MTSCSGSQRPCPPRRGQDLRERVPLLRRPLQLRPHLRAPGGPLRIVGDLRVQEIAFRQKIQKSNVALLASYAELPEGRIHFAVLDLIGGDQTLFVRRDEVEAQWQWVDAIREVWEKAEIKPKTYNAGTWGPSAAIALAERDGVTWHD